MAKFRDFGVAKSADDLEEISFSLQGETFGCRKAVPGKVMLDLAALSGDEENVANAAKAIDIFFKAVLKSDEEYKRFDRLCKDPDVMINVETLFDIVQWLMETYGERPTQRSEDSQTGQ